MSKREARWREWNNEIYRYRALETQGFQKDMEELAAHIATLERVAPKQHDDTSILMPSAIAKVDILKTTLGLGRAWLEAGNKEESE